MKIKFTLYDNEELLPSENISNLKLIEKQGTISLFEATIKTINDIAIRCPDGVVKHINAMINKEGYCLPIEWYYSYF